MAANSGAAKNIRCMVRSQSKSVMKILLVHLVHNDNTKLWYQSVADVSCDGLEVVPFGVASNPQGTRLSWLQLDASWRRKDPGLMRMYEHLQAAASDCDVLLLYNGAHLHPEMLEHLGTFNVFCCFDDPEASAGLSKPVAEAFDAVFYGNIAAQFQYESWGCSKKAWLPVFVSPKEIPSQIEKQDVLNCVRDNDIVICCDRNNYRSQRLDQLVRAFPQAHSYGQGWRNGWIDPKGLSEVYRRSKIGWNVHNSTGPINQRLFTLPAYGVMQICDNKTGLGQIFELGKEAIGFDHIGEAIDATRYYLNHADQRIDIAVNGYLRFEKEYHPTHVWERIVRQLKCWGVSDRTKQLPIRNTLPVRSRLESVRYTLGDAKRVVARWSAQLVCAKKDAGPVIKPIDEQAYLAPPVGRNGDQVALTKPSTPRQLESSQINAEAVAWAITSLLGKGKKIGVVGSAHTTLNRLIITDPSRTVYQIDPSDQSISLGGLGCDVAIWLDGISHGHCLSDVALHLSQYAQRVILIVPNQMKTGGLAPTTVYKMLTTYYESTRLYHMPEADVPWLEPLTPDSQGNPIIACCDRKQIIAKNKAA